MKIALSFSGGKDSSLALSRLQRAGHDVVCLLTTVVKSDFKTVAHGEALEQLELQANRMGIPVHFIYTDFPTYTDDFISVAQTIKKEYQVTGIAFGDIYLDGHREWGEGVAKQTNLEALYPLWIEKKSRLTLLQEFVDLGFQAHVIKVDKSKLPSAWIGRKIDAGFIHDITKMNVCPLGEHGEYHTTVTDGPIFR